MTPTKNEANSEPQSTTKEAIGNTDQDPPSSNHTPKLPPSTCQARMLSSIEVLKSNVSSTESQLSAKLHEITKIESFQSSQQSDTKTDTDKAAQAHAQSIINKHISLLKRYNEIKDIALGMLSLIAEKEGKRLAEVMEERGVSEKD